MERYIGGGGRGVLEYLQHYCRRSGSHLVLGIHVSKESSIFLRGGSVTENLV